jgi:hypothetical protein
MIVRQKLGQLASPTLIREDVNASGGVSSADAMLVQRALGKTVTP